MQEVCNYLFLCDVSIFFPVLTNVLRVKFVTLKVK